jgi:multiple sugar transport system permease protein
VNNHAVFQKGRLSGVLVYLPVLAYASLILLPFYFLLISSFKTTSEVFASPLGLPTSLAEGWENYRMAEHQGQLLRSLGNSLFITGGAEVLTLVLAVPAAFGIARSRSRVASFLEFVFGVAFLIPPFALLVPTFLLAALTGLFQTRLFIILFYPAMALPLAVIILVRFMRAIPPELEESAVMDGAGPWSVMWRIYAPLALPGIATVALLNFLTFWNEYIFALIILGPEVKTRTIQMAIPTLRGSRMVDFGLLGAGTVISLVVVYLVYVVLQKRMHLALTAGAVKG